MRYGIVSILTSQYRLTPIEKKRLRRLRIPNDPDFPLAMKFFEIRRCIEPGLQKIWEEWQEIYKEPETAAPVRRKRRRRKRPSSSERKNESHVDTQE